MSLNFVLFFRLESCNIIPCYWISTFPGLPVSQRCILEVDFVKGWTADVFSPSPHWLAVPPNVKEQIPSTHCIIKSAVLQHSLFFLHSGINVGIWKNFGSEEENASLSCLLKYYLAWEVIRCSNDSNTFWRNINPVQPGPSRVNQVFFSCYVTNVVAFVVSTVSMQGLNLIQHFAAWNIGKLKCFILDSSNFTGWMC